MQAFAALSDPTRRQIVELLSKRELTAGDIAARFPDVPGFQGLTSLSFARPLGARHWLQASNPSERWKWDFMFQDLPPVKGAVELTSLPPEPIAVIPLKEVK